MKNINIMWTLFVVVLILKVIQKLQFPSSIIRIVPGFVQPWKIGEKFEILGKVREKFL